MVEREIAGWMEEEIIDLEHPVLGDRRVIGRWLPIGLSLLMARGCSEVIHEQSESQLHYMRMDN